MLEKHKRFCEEYIKDFNAAAAARRVGYHRSGDRVRAAEILQRPEVQSYLKEIIEGVRNQNQMEVDDLVQSLKRIAFSDIGDYFDEDNNILPIHKIENGPRAALEQYQDDEYPSNHGVRRIRRIKLRSKLDAIEKLMKYMGAYDRDNRQRGNLSISAQSTDELKDELAAIRRRRVLYEEE